MNNKLTDETLKAWKTEAMISLGETPKDCRDYSHHEAILALVTELQERRKADSQEPAGYHVIKEGGKVGCSVATLEEAEKTRDFWNKKWTIRPYFYTAPPVQETGVYKDMLNIINLLENNEWAEYCTSTVLGSLLESEITRLVGMTQSAPIMSLPDDWQVAPKKPNGPMLTAGYQAYVKGQHRGRFYRSYQAMLEAAPKLSEVNK